MTALLTRLRIAGFKSFAEPATLDILPGLTGIVGPNGCGKSNVVEALRWAMGETSVRSLRGGEMDDVIFAGTSARASRNLAEVAITLQRGEGALPDPFGADEELTVTRRIERGAGSVYRGNGREMRARDVQTLFADLASGAHSTAMVSQGRVSALVNAKPEQRRQVLEEAAGITGLHARRHEADLKLRAAETNLSRAEELRTQLDQSRESLRRQARQAARFRSLSHLVRQAETEFLAVQHWRAAVALAAAEQAQLEAAASAEAASSEAAAASEAVASAEQALAAPREAEAAARSLLERRRFEAATLADEAGRAARALATAQARLAEIESDLEDATRGEDDARTAVTGFAAEAARIATRLAELPGQIALAAAVATDAAVALQDAETDADAAARCAAEAEAAARQAALALRSAEARVAAAQAARAEADAACEEAAAALIAPETLARANEAASAAEAAWGIARAEAEAAEQRRAQAAAAEHDALAAVARAGAQAEREALLVREAAARFSRIETALAELTHELSKATAARIADVDLGQARTAAAGAAEAATAAERAARAAEQVHGAAVAASLERTSAYETLRAEHARCLESLAQAAARRDQLAGDEKLLAHELAAAQAEHPEDRHILAAELGLNRVVSDLAAAAEVLRASAAVRAAASVQAAAARGEAEAAALDAGRLSAEANGLLQALVSQDDAANLLDDVHVPAGLEAALGAALSHARGALDDASPSFWRSLPDLPSPPWPPGANNLADLVAAPAPLARVLAYTALLPAGADGNALQAALPPGAALVSPEGDLWRWDGQVIRADAPNPATMRLRQHARLRDIEAAHTEAAARAAELLHRQQRDDAALQAASEAEEAARAHHSAAEAALALARQAHAATLTAAERAAAQLAALRPAVARLAAERNAADAALAHAEAALAALSDPTRLGEQAEAAAEAARATAARLAEARDWRDAATARAADTAAALQRLQSEAAAAEHRCASLTPQIARLTAERAEAQAARADAHDAQRALPDIEALRDEAGAATAALVSAQHAVAAARSEETAAAERARARTAQAAALDRASDAARHALEARRMMLGRAEADLARDQDAHSAAHAALAALPDPAALADAVFRAREKLTSCRAALSGASASHAALLNEAASLHARSPAVAAEQEAWATRAADAARRVSALAARRDSEAGEVAALTDAPAELARRTESARAALDAAEAAHDNAAETLRSAEQNLRSAGHAQRDAETRAGACREALARGEGSLAAAAAAVATIAENIAERLGPDAVLPDADDLSDTALERARKKYERLTRERDEMGPVNLRADLELDEIDAKINEIDRDREELATAIAKLRGSIGHLNREGRERLAAIFTEVDKHFRALFTRMMGGGRAHLALTGSDDPLEAGLEIYAEPPGKKLSTLSLLSGGEQALTALSLIFAVFRCTPAPIAVLDEVDAPLDDANVDRFCALLEDVVHETGTRFLVVTHHQLTMSRMDRLYGVTMQERGVSRLLSVDLRRAAEMAEQAPSLVAAE
jgi:chromosome segregation protein